MPNWRRQFKILTHRKTVGTWPSSLNIPRSYDCPEYVVVSWCKKRKRFRFKYAIATGIPYSWSESKMFRLGPRRTLIPKEDAIDSFGSELAAQNGLPWVRCFDPSWKLHDLMLMRLKGKI